MQKLVRDRIPESIRQNGARPITRRLTHDKVLPALFQKLDDEVAELRGTGTLEEMADVLEVLIALAAELREFHHLAWFNLDALPYPRTEPHLARFTDKKA